ncbi:hypothetical protein SO802_031636 [Lithocarpus litseifolius]|uniref:Uncharacterized protein n=1 Tax=Lithocarpus litseifolius TaxID=425828 RepID=A0AAW2BRN4_9ROSI
MNCMVQQFQNLKSNQEEDKTDHDPPAVDNEKKTNERMNKMEEMIRRSRKMEDLMDYDSLSLFFNFNIEVDITRRDLETTMQEPKESFSTFITKWRAKTAQMMKRPSEEEQLAMVVKNLLHVYHKYLFAQYFPNFKALIAVGT